MFLKTTTKLRFTRFQESSGSPLVAPESFLKSKRAEGPPFGLLLGRSPLLVAPKESEKDAICAMPTASTSFPAPTGLDNLPEDPLHAHSIPSSSSSSPLIRSAGSESPLHDIRPTS